MRYRVVWWKHRGRRGYDVREHLLTTRRGQAASVLLCGRRMPFLTDPELLDVHLTTVNANEPLSSETCQKCWQRAREEAKKP